MIDEKGRLFGKINIIDLIVVTVLIAVIAAGVYMFTARKNTGQETQTQAYGDVYVTVVARLVPEEVGEQLKVGDKLVAKGAFTNAEITEISVEPGKWVSWTAEGVGVSTFHPLWKDVTVVIKDKCPATSPIVKVGGQEARTGLTSFILKTQMVEVPATVLDVEFK